MNETTVNQSFNVDDIRRIRNEASMRYEGKTYEEISKEITKGAQVGHQILAELKKKKSEQKAV